MSDVKDENTMCINYVKQVAIRDRSECSWGGTNRVAAILKRNLPPDINKTYADVN